MFYVYVLESKKDKKLYIGSMSNLKRRFNEHSEGKVKSTSYRRPLELIYYEAYRKEEIALARIGQGYSPSRCLLNYQLAW